MEHSHHHHHTENCGCGHHGIPSTPQQVKALQIAFVTIACFSGLELWVSTHSHSVSLLADAGHMMCDVFAIALALWTAGMMPKWTAAKQEQMSAIAALVNGTLLLVISLWLGWEAIEAVRFPGADMLTRPVALTATLGLAVNGVNAYLLHRHADDDLNMRGAFLHLLADAGSCLGVLIGAVLVAKFGWVLADGVIGGGIAVLVGWGAIPLMVRSWQRLSQSSDPARAA